MPVQAFQSTGVCNKSVLKFVCLSFLCWFDPFFFGFSASTSLQPKPPNTGNANRRQDQTYDQADRSIAHRTLYK
eukprot:3809751-Amphidinium_carterae.1